MVLPAATAVTTPLEFTVATEVLLELQVLLGVGLPPEYVQVPVADSPGHRLESPLIDGLDGGVQAITVMLAVAEMLSQESVTV